MLYIYSLMLAMYITRLSSGNTEHYEYGASGSEPDWVCG